MKNIFLQKKWFLILITISLLISCQQNEKNIYQNYYKDDFTAESFSNWQPNIPENWEILNEDGTGILHLIKAGAFGEIRKPTSYAILNSIDATDFELTVEIKCLADTALVGRDLNIIFGFQDSVHFYYAHICNDNARVHNIIGIVNGKDREPITKPLNDNSKIKLTDYNWHKVKLTRDISSGKIELFVDSFLIHSSIDKSLNQGKLGLGSFDDFGMFRNFELKYNIAD
ncbi:MAG: hypothetical protein H6609_18100 [Ignavibacteriales bacterium]|nr:hypothetical protein [Ignavibacteriales bacterium]